MKYNFYKQSKYDWIQEIPEHWNEQRLKTLLKCHFGGCWGGDESPDGDNYLCVRIADFDFENQVVKKGAKTYRHYSLSKISSGRLRDEDIILEKSGGGELTPVGRTVLYHGDDDATVMFANFSECLRVNKKKINPTYLAYYLKFFYYVANMKRFYKQTTGIQNVDMPEFLSAGVIIPPRTEQDQIVRYLDWQVSKINKLIAAKKKEINLLDERQRSFVCNLVINGTKSNCKKKLSGINWAEEIPEEWEVLYLSQVSNERSVKNTGMVEDNLLSLSYGHIVNKNINTTEGLLPASFEGYQIVLPGNIILRLTDLQNDHKSLRVGLSTQKGIITSAYTCLNVHENILPEYLYLQLHAADLCKVFYGMGGGVRQSIGYKDIRRMLIAVPPLDEQRRIVDTLKESNAPTEAVISKLNEEIKKLEELKTKIISDAVTGKIDVRGVEIPDYEYVEEEANEGENIDEEPEKQEVDEE